MAACVCVCGLASLSEGEEGRDSQQECLGKGTEWRAFLPPTLALHGCGSHLTGGARGELQGSEAGIERERERQQDWSQLRVVGESWGRNGRSNCCFRIMNR